MNDPVDISVANSNAEEALIGSLLIESSRGTDEAIRKASKILEPTDFKGCIPTDPPARWTPAGRIFYAMSLCEHPPHIINCTMQLIKLGILETTDPEYMDWCMGEVPCSLDYLDYAQTVKEYSLQRLVHYYSEHGNYERLHKITAINKRKGFEL